MSRQDGEQLVSPRSWTSHPLYHQPTTDYDFAIVKLLTHVRSAQYSQHIRNTLAHPGRFTARVSPVCLPSPSTDYDSVTATVSGWGTLRHGGGTPNTLQKVQCSAASALSMFPCPGPGADDEQLRVHEDGVQQQADHLQHALCRRPRQGRVSGGSLLQCCVRECLAPVCRGTAAAPW